MRDEAARRAAGVLRQLRLREPRTAGQLWEFVRCYYGLSVPRRRVCPGHVSPMEYVAASFFQVYGDLVVWANRGGAKTELGSVATHLESVFRPGLQTRILGGSLQQSERMYAYLGSKWSPHFADLLSDEPHARRTALTNGSVIEILTQSERSVRGQRVQRVRCDEVDEFDPAVWRAVQFVTQSRGEVRASVEAFSTMHHPYGLMSRVVDGAWNVAGSGRGMADGAGVAGEGCRVGPGDPPYGFSGGQEQDAPGTHRQDARATGRAWVMPDGAGMAPVGPDMAPGQEQDAPGTHGQDARGTGGGRGPALMAWCLWETIERCTGDRSCSRCPLSEDCRGRAREAEGFLRIDDAIAQMRRSGREAWESEMLCLRPRQENLVFPRFSAARHVRRVEAASGWPVYRSLDFGYVNPFVCLWAQVVGDDPATARVHVLGEYVASRRTVAEHASVLKSRPWPVRATFCDPAGRQRGDVTGSGACQELARLGILTTSCASGIMEGVDLVRALLEPALGPERLVVDGGCERLIRALGSYHYPASGGSAELPEKDGEHDHLIDALRYLVVNLFGRGGGGVRSRSYW